MFKKLGWFCVLVVLCSGVSAVDYALLNEMFSTHLNYFLSDDSVNSYGLPLTAYKVGDRARYGYSNPTEWGYLLQAYIAGAERGIITQEEALGKINISLDTMVVLQNDPAQSYEKLFYPYYTVTTSSGIDIFPYHNPDIMIPSVDNALLYSSLLITEGWAKEINNPEIEIKAKAIKDQMDFSIFLFTQDSDKYLAHQINADTHQLSASKWDVFADEGGLMALIAYISDSVNFTAYQQLTNSQIRESKTWNGYVVKEASWFNSMFAWGVRSIAGFKVANTSYSFDSFVPAARAHIAYRNFIDIDYPAFSDAMSQVNGTGRHTPPNLANVVPDYIPYHVMPHAFFIPFNVLRDLDNDTIDNLTHLIMLLKDDAAGYYHDSGTFPFGFEVLASPFINDTAFSGSADGRNIFEALSNAYTALSLFTALQYIDSSKDFYGFAKNVGGYEDKIQDTLGFLYPACSCSSWDSQSCGAGSCAQYEMFQTRVCSPSGCDIEQRCIYDESCTGSIITVCRNGSCDYTSINEAVDNAPSGWTVLITDEGVYDEEVAIGNVSVGKSGVTLDCNGAALEGSGAGYGIYLSKGGSCIVKNCIITNYSYGIRTWDNTGNLFANNKILNNDIGFSSDNADSLSVVGNNISYNREGVRIYWSTSGHLIKDNVLFNNKDIGIIFSWFVHDSVVKDNIVAGSSNGIFSDCMYGDKPSYNNIYSDNIMVNNTYGFYTINSYNNTIRSNNIADNAYGIYISGGHDNLIYLNELVNNSNQSFDSSSNLWNKTVGNYWNNYDEPGEGCDDLDLDDFCDSPYIIDGNSQDSLPFTKDSWSSVEKFTLNLIPAWNLVSLPIEPFDNLIDSIMKGCGYNRIWEFQSDQSWTSTDTGLTSMDIYHGYWVDRTGFSDNCTLLIEGEEPESTIINVSSGWNLVGYPSLSSREISSFINGTLYNRIWEFDKGWKSTDTGLVNMTPERGYWIDGNEEGSYEVTSP